MIQRLLRPRRVLLAAIVALAGAVLWLRLGPLPPGLLDGLETSSTTVVDRYGERLYEVRSERGLRGEWIESWRVPRFVTDATMAAEDERFRWHVGVDPIAVVRALWRNLRHGEIAEGGSTISQQAAELLLGRLANGAAERGWKAKFRETVVALRLEHRLTKSEILAIYVNLAPYGNQIQGVARASRAYFGRDVSSLTVSEAAFLAALPQQPSRFNPWRRPDAARARQARILDRMRDRGWLSPQAHASARQERLALARDTAVTLAPHFVERVLATPGASRARRVETTLDATLQRTVHGIIDAKRRTLDEHDASNVAVAVLDNRTGEWLAWEGSGDYFDARDGGAIDGVVSPRQPGSALKPFTYAAAFERGWHPGSVLADVPSQFPTAEPGILYSPRNYDNQFRGPLLARAALAGSENVPAVALASEVGVAPIARLLRRVGLSTLDNNTAHYGLGLTLGNAEVRLDELVAAYAMLARGGETVRPTMIRTVDGTSWPRAAGERIVSLRSAFWVTDILSDNEAREFVFGRGGSLEFPFAVASKTGTSQAYHDNWALGYTPEVTVGVWVGNFDRRPLRGSSGVTGAGPIFHEVLLAAVERVRGALPMDDAAPVIAPPSDVLPQDICALSGMAAGQACPVRRAEWLPVGSHESTCDWHHTSDGELVTMLPEVYREWARGRGEVANGASDGRPSTGSSAGPEVPGLQRQPVRVEDARRSLVVLASAPPARGAVRPASIRTSSSDFSIVRPLGGALFLIDPTLRPEFQTLSLQSRGAAPGAVEWFVDDQTVGFETDTAPLRWPLSRGHHRITARDQAGRTTQTTVEVR